MKKRRHTYRTAFGFDPRYKKELDWTKPGLPKRMNRWLLFGFSEVGSSVVVSRDRETGCDRRISRVPNAAICTSPSSWPQHHTRVTLITRHRSRGFESTECDDKKKYIGPKKLCGRENTPFPPRWVFFLFVCPMNTTNGSGCLEISRLPSVKDNSASTKYDPVIIFFSCLTFVCLHYTGRQHRHSNEWCSETTYGST